MYGIKKDYKAIYIGKKNRQEKCIELINSLMTFKLLIWIATKYYLNFSIILKI